AIENTASGGPDRVQLFAHVLLITGQLLRQVGRLRHHDPADHSDDGKREQDHDQRGSNARDSQTAQADHQRRQQKSKQNGQREWDEYFASKIKNRYDNNGREEDFIAEEGLAAFVLKPVVWFSMRFSYAPK